MTQLEGAHVLVVGAGRSGAAATRALLRRGTAVTVLETGVEAAGIKRAEDLRGDGASVSFSAASVDVAAMDLVVLSPGVPEHHPVAVAAATAAVPVWSEPELAWRMSQGRTTLVAVTGTNGKTTTTELLAACLDAPTGGNIGTPLVELLDGDDAPPVVVAELSSFQLRFCHTLRPHVAVLLNVAPDHLDWHGSVDSYRAAKARIWARQEGDDTAVVNADDEGARATVAAHPPPAATLEFTLGPPSDGQVGVEDGCVVARLGRDAATVVAVDELGLRGPHNLANACAATAAALTAGAQPDAVSRALRAHRPGRHRMETVATIGGVAYVDDSKATNPHAAAAALSTYDPGSVVWIAGGLAKGLRFDTLGDVVARHVRTAVTIGAAGPAIADIARAAGVAAVEAHTLDSAVRAAADVARPGDTVLLSPACASMDQFTDYRERGETFRTAVTALAAQGASCGH